MKRNQQQGGIRAVAGNGKHAKDDVALEQALFEAWLAFTHPLAPGPDATHRADFIADLKRVIPTSEKKLANEKTCICGLPDDSKCEMMVGGAMLHGALKPDCHECPACGGELIGDIAEGYVSDPESEDDDQQQKNEAVNKDGQWLCMECGDYFK